ncbi:MAG: tRNA (adenosine(37)-N6)-threonylcarbamoyltransferase complex transferase subunit TsaD [Alphaproteobacteria bacterium]
MIILGIESSCDETAAAVVTDDKKILSSVVVSQLDEHRAFGGVVPEIAARAHLEYIEDVIAKAVKDSGVSLDEIDAVCATSGPGLIGGVIVGMTSAKAISLAKQIPFVAVNHLEGHALTARITSDVSFPYLLLLVSGGHCQILIVKDVGCYECLGETLDDAAGEAFDKVAKMMNVGYPGGVAVEKMAQKGDSKRFKLARPMKGKAGCNLSFSGLKTSVRHLIESFSEDKTLENAKLTEQDKADICASFQEAVCDTIINRLKKAVIIFKEQYPEGKFLVVSGGVASNLALREALTKLAQKNHLIFEAPPISLCTDNGVMIAWAGIERFKKGFIDNLSFKPKPRWPLF